MNKFNTTDQFDFSYLHLINRIVAAGMMHGLGGDHFSDMVF